MTPEETRFLQSFEDCTLPPVEWTHAAHVRMAWLCLQSDEFDAALRRIRAGILRYNGKVLDKLAEYHETVTVAFAWLVASRIQTDETWQQFADRNQDLFARKPPALAAYYSPDRLMSAKARASFVDPDLQPLPALTSGLIATGPQV